MPTKFGPEENAVIIRFGGGVNSTAADDEIAEREAAAGDNFTLDVQSSTFQPRSAFDKLGTTPNGSEIRGFANLQKTDGTVSMLVQAGTEVYEWDGSSFSSSKGTVSSTAQLRGPLSQNWLLDDEVIITDLNLQEPVMKWDGTTLSTVSFTDESSASWTGEFRAKYATISSERVVFGNVYDNGSTFPHLIVGAKRGDYTVLSVSQRPSSALSAEDPFFLIQPDYKPVNGQVQAFGILVTSSKNGELFKLTGANATDFAFESFYPRSGVAGDEGMVFTGNDIIYGRPGRIESLKASDKFGDTENDDLSIKISSSIESIAGWTLAYNQRNQRIYCFPDGDTKMWVLFKPMLNTELSPWARWITAHSTSFQPTTVMSMLDPGDNLEYTFFGDSSGNLYRLEGSGSSGDGGTDIIRTTRSSAQFRANLDAIAYQVQGWIKYKSLDEADIDITILYNGVEVFDQSISVTIPASSGRKVYGGGYYYSDANYYSESLSGRLTRREFQIPHGAEEFQVRITYNGTARPEIQEIGLRFEETA